MIIKLSIEGHRAKVVEHQKKVQRGSRRSVAVVDGAKAGIAVNGVPVKRVVLDTGANEAMIHVNVKAKLGDVAMKANGKSSALVARRPSCPGPRRHLP